MKPILFKPDMVSAILTGNKTQTRRIVKISDEELGELNYEAITIGRDSQLGWIVWVGRKIVKRLKPKYEVGDILWVREIWQWEGETKYTDAIPIGNFWYKTDFEEGEGPSRWKPSIHMPKIACRLFLEVTDIRVEKLQNISEDGCKAEGIESNTFINGMEKITAYKIYGSKNSWDESPIVSYWSLWESINGPGSWESNPFVWVIKFKRHEM